MINQKLIITQQSHHVNNFQIKLIVLDILIMLGYLYSIDQPQATENILLKPPYSLTHQQYTLIYSFTTLPNIFLNIIGGIILDKIFLWNSLLFLELMLFLSQLTITIAIWKIFDFWFYIVLGARTFLGIFGENLYTVQASIIIMFFSQKKIDKYLGIVSIVPYIFVCLNSILSTNIYQLTKSLGLTYFIGTIFSFISCIIGIILARFMKLKTKTVKKILVSPNLSDQQKINNQNKSLCSYGFWLLVLLEGLVFIDWAVFMDNANDYLIKRCSFNLSQAGFIIIIPYFVLIISSLIIGHYNSNTIKKRILLIYSSICLLCSHVSFFLLKNTQNRYQHRVYNFIVSIIGFVLLGIGYAGILIIGYSLISQLIPKNKISTGFAIVGMFQCLFESIPLIGTAYIINQSWTQAEGYRNTSYCFIGVSVVMIGLSLMINFSTNRFLKKLDKCQEINMIPQSSEYIQDTNIN